MAKKNIEHPLQEWFELIQQKSDIELSEAIDKTIKNNGRIKYQRYSNISQNQQDDWTSITSISYFEMDLKTLSKKIKSK